MPCAGILSPILFSMIGLASLVTSVIACEDCLDYATDPVEPIVGTLDVTDDPFDVAVRGDRVYMVANNSRFPDDPVVHELLVVDVSDPAAPIQLGVLDSPWGHFSIDVEGDMVYACSPALAKIDVSNPQAPEQLGYFDFAELPRDIPQTVDVEAPYAYIITDVIGSNEGRLRVFDVSGDAPLYRGFLGITDGLNDLVTRWPYVYAIGSNEFWVVDVSDPTDPIAVGNLTLEFLGTDIALREDVAVVSVSQRPSVVIDISSPTAPALLGDGPSMGQFE
ncbi:MAG: hypothetical protein GF346_06980, partial [Candidatus Eisenbacteria bacterium]|nr:hypothetical protein [Candidatus Latescibacterota bacterium]MBD3302173.1 hypothetical protein [Candidatus Eisenbacteria bacterium]